MRRLVIAALFVALTPLAVADEYIVSTTADHGPGSLRSAIDEANAYPGAASRKISIQTCGIVTLTSPLPPITAAHTSLVVDDPRYPCNFLTRWNNFNFDIDGRLAGDASASS